jgi:hypothetical protein
MNRTMRDVVCTANNAMSSEILNPGIVHELTEKSGE